MAAMRVASGPGPGVRSFASRTMTTLDFCAGLASPRAKFVPVPRTATPATISFTNSRRLCILPPSVLRTLQRVLQLAFNSMRQRQQCVAHTGSCLKGGNPHQIRPLAEDHALPVQPRGIAQLHALAIARRIGVVDCLRAIRRLHRVYVDGRLQFSLELVCLLYTS